MNEPSLVELYGRVRHRSAATLTTASGVKTYGEHLHFIWEDYRVLAVIMSSYCARIQYHKTGAWSEAEIQRLLKLNESSFGDWAEVKSRTRGLRDWKAGDIRTAQWNRADSTLVIELKDYPDMMKLLRQRRTPKKEGF